MTNSDKGIDVAGWDLINQKDFSLFDSLGIPVWEEDFSELKKYFNNLSIKGILDFRKYFAENTEDLYYCASLIKITNVNNESLSFFEVSNKTELIKSLPHYFTKESYITFKEELIALAEGQTSFKDEIIIKNLKGERKNLLLQLIIDDEFLDSWSRVLVSFIDITKQKQSEEALRESELRLRAILDGSIDAIGVSKNGIHTFANPAYYKLFGYENETELVGTSILNLIAPESRNQIIESVRLRSLGEFAPTEYEVKALRKNGLTFDMEIHLSNYILNHENYTLVILRDITKNKQVEDKLRFESFLLNNITDAIISTDINFNITSWNKAAEKIYGWTLEEVYGKAIFELLNVEFQKEDKSKIIKIVFENGVWKGESTQHSKMGDLIWISGSINLLRGKDNEPNSILFSNNDITYKKLDELKIIENEKRLNQIIEQLPYPVEICNSEGTAIQVNDAFLKMFDVPSKDFVINKYNVFLDEIVMKTMNLEESIRRVYNGEMVVIKELRFQNNTLYDQYGIKDSNDIYQEVTMFPVFNSSGKISEVVTIWKDITEKKKIDLDLHESEKRFRKVNSLVSDVTYSCWEDKKGTFKIDWISGAITLITGYCEKEIYEKGCWGFLVLKEDNHIFVKNVLKLALNTSCKSEFRIAKKDGNIRWIESFAECILEFEPKEIKRIYGGLVDITDRKQVEFSLRESEEKYRSLTESSSQAIFTVEYDGKFLFMNRACAKQLNGYPEDFIGKNMWTLFPKDIADGQMTTIRRAFETDDLIESSRETIVAGNKKFYETRIQSIKNSAGIRDKALVILNDVTEKNMIHNELLKSYMDLEETLAKLKETKKQVLLQEKLRSLGQMTSGICHDINNSLSPIMGFADMLCRDEEVMKKHERKLVNIIKSTKNIANTIGRLKEFYKVKLEFDNLTEKDINRIINTTIELTSHKWKNIAESTGSVVTIKREFQKNLPLTKVDESELIEALTNVILNSCDAMIDGGTLSFKTYQNESNIVIEVRDTGMGMDEETLQRCLDPFYSTKGEQGTGLGLSMVFGVMERHKGEIKIESEKNKGTTVKLILPVDKSIIENDKIDEIVKDLKPLKILSVEDDKTISEMLKLMLETKGNRVESALNGKVGLELYQQALKKRDPFDLVITDLGMAEMDGNSLSKIIKEMTPDIPVILLTGWGTLIDKNDYKTVDCLLKKPIMMEDLFRAIAGLFEEK